MKNRIRLLGIIAFVAVIAFTMSACASLSPNDGSEKINNVDGLKEYLESQPANSHETPLKITLKFNSSMIKDVADILRSTDKFVSLKLDMGVLASAYAMINLPDSAFQDCKSLINLDLEYSGITRIGDNAFRGCTNLASLTIPYDLGEFSLTAYTALADCPSLTAINGSYSKVYSSDQGVLYSKDKKRLIFCPQGKTGAYTTPDSVWEIAPYAFYGSKITSITIDGGYGFDMQRGGMVYYTIGDNAFINCSNLTSVTIKSAVRFGSDKVFDGNFQEVYEAPAIITFKDGRKGVDAEKLGGTFTRPNGNSQTWTKQ